MKNLKNRMATLIVMYSCVFFSTKAMEPSADASALLARSFSDVFVQKMARSLNCSAAAVSSMNARTFGTIPFTPASRITDEDRRKAASWFKWPVDYVRSLNENEIELLYRVYDVQLSWPLAADY